MANARALKQVLILGSGFGGLYTALGLEKALTHHRESVRLDRHLTPDMLRVILVHPGEVILPELGSKLGLRRARFRQTVRNECARAILSSSTFCPY